MSHCSAEDRIKVNPLAARNEKSCEWDSIAGLFRVPGCSGTARYAATYWAFDGHYCEQHARLQVERSGPCVELVPVTEHEICEYEPCGASAIYVRREAVDDFALCPAHSLQLQQGIDYPALATT